MSGECVITQLHLAWEACEYLGSLGARRRDPCRSVLSCVATARGTRRTRPARRMSRRWRCRPADRDGDGVAQRLYYHPGVGVRKWERTGGGAFGIGLSRNVVDTYRFVPDNYEPGDELVDSCGHANGLCGTPERTLQHRAAGEHHFEFMPDRLSAAEDSFAMASEMPDPGRFPGTRWDRDELPRRQDSRYGRLTRGVSGSRTRYPYSPKFRGSS